jgi:DNA repair exonuclease SbcCD ATPase subunit
MRVHRLTVRNYRIHRDVTVRFDDRLTLIAGANETGKSTLLEALHRGLYLRPRAAGNALQQMKSATHDGAPEVEVEFSTNEGRYTVRKVFSGNTGTILLTAAGKPNLTGQAAETELAELLGIDGLIAAGGIENHAVSMGHLWVRQGNAMDETGTYVPEGPDLLELLQQDGAAGILMSEADRALTSAIDTTVGTIYNQARTAFLVNSEAGRAEIALNAARNTYGTAAATVTRLSTASAELRESENSARECATIAATIQQEIYANEIILANINELTNQKLTREFDAQQANSIVSSLELINQNIATIRSALSIAKAELLPLETQVAGYEASLQGSRVQLATAETNLTRARSTASKSRARRDFAQHNVTRLQKEIELKQLESKQEKVSLFDASKKSYQQELERTALIDLRAIRRLNRLRDKIIASEAELNAVATGIIVESAAETVSVGGVQFQAGQSCVVTADTTVSVGSGTTIRIRPGGGATLEEKANALRANNSDLAEQLSALRVTSIEEAESAVDTRNRIEAAISAIEENQSILLNGESDLSANLERLRREDADAERMLRAAESASDMEVTTDLTQAIETLAATQLAVTQSESAEQECQSAFEGAQNHTRSIEKELQRNHIEITNKRNSVGTQTALLDNLIANHGGDDARSEQLANAKNSALVARRNLDIVEDSLAKLNPDNANLLKNRLAASLTNNSARLEAANARINQAKGILMGMGQEDPEETAAIARANLDRAQEEFDRHSKRAKALKLIEELIQTERSNINNAQSVPLTSRMEPYLRTVFGPETNVAVRWNDNNEFDHIAIERNSRGEGALPFAALSGGAREQAGVALRLALAELINQKNGQDQSVILDDTFANSDPDRIRQLQTMLYLGAERGLQIVVLTCNSTDYATLGGTRHDLAFAPAMRGRG